MQAYEVVDVVEIDAVVAELTKFQAWLPTIQVAAIECLPVAGAGLCKR